MLDSRLISSLMVKAQWLTYRSNFKMNFVDERYVPGGREVEDLSTHPKPFRERTRERKQDGSCFSDGSQLASTVGADGKFYNDPTN